MITDHALRLLRADTARPAGNQPAPAVLLASPAATSRDVWALVTGAVFAVVLLSPLRHYFGEDKRAKSAWDSFPLSTYPMFSEDRKNHTRVPHVVGFTAQGERVLPHHQHFGAGGLNQVRKQIARMVRHDRAVDVAQRYADALNAQNTRGPSRGSGPGATRRRKEARIIHVEVVRSRFDFTTYYAGTTIPQAETVHARCEIGGTAEPVSLTRKDHS